MGLAILARLFCCAKRFAFGSTGGAGVVAQVVDAESPERRQECLRHLSEDFCFGGGEILRRQVEAWAATTEAFLRGGFLRDARLCCGARCGRRAKGCARDGVGAG